MGVRSAGDEIVRVVVRPQVPMGVFQALGYICAMGAVDGLREAGVDFAAIGWPQDVVDGRTYRPLFTLRMHAGYNKGMFGECTVMAAQQIGLLRAMEDGRLAEALRHGIEERVESWASQIEATGGKAAPLAPILSEYFDMVALMGKHARAVYPNGNEMARGTFAGVDIWGRATLTTDDGRELEFPPEQASIQPA